MLNMADGHISQFLGARRWQHLGTSANPYGDSPKQNDPKMTHGNRKGGSRKRRREEQEAREGRDVDARGGEGDACWEAI